MRSQLQLQLHSHWNWMLCLQVRFWMPIEWANFGPYISIATSWLIKQASLAALNLNGVLCWTQQRQQIAAEFASARSEISLPANGRDCVVLANNNNNNFTTINNFSHKQQSLSFSLVRPIQLAWFGRNNNKLEHNKHTHLFAFAICSQAMWHQH